MKSIISDKLVHFVIFFLGNKKTEKGILFLCRNCFLRKLFKPGRLAFSLVDCLEKREERVAEMGRYRFWVNIAESHGLFSYFFKKPQVPSFCLETIKKGDCFFDVGANMGHWTFAVAAQEVKVFSFEPNPTNFRMLKNSIELNGWNHRVTLVEKALWNKSGEKLEFFLSEDRHNSGTSSLIRHSLIESTNSVITVETVTGDDYIRLNQIDKIDLMKVDVERAEYEVLFGFQDSFKKGIIRWIHLETAYQSKAYLFLEENGYICSGEIEGGERLKSKEEKWGGDSHEVGDYWFYYGGELK